MIKEGRARKKNALVVAAAAAEDVVVVEDDDCGKINWTRSIPRLDVVDVLDFPEIVKTEQSEREMEVLYYWKCSNCPRLPL